VIIEDRIRDWEAGRKPGIHSFRAANGIAQFLPSALAHPYGISNRDLTMRPASASRLTRAHLAKGPSAPRRTTQRLCFAISNREPELLELSLTYRKQTKAPSSNRELTMRRASASRASAPRRTTRGICSAFSSSGLPTNLGGNNSQLLPQNLPQIRKWSRALLTGSALQTEFGLTYRKQTTEKFLTEARTHIRETGFAQHPDTSPLGFPK
jgi:hypothetical protein